MNNILKNSSKFLTVLILGLSLFLNVNGLTAPLVADADTQVVVDPLCDLAIKTSKQVYYDGLTYFLPVNATEYVSNSYMEHFDIKYILPENVTNFYPKDPKPFGPGVALFTSCYNQEYTLEEFNTAFERDGEYYDTDTDQIISTNKNFFDGSQFIGESTYFYPSREEFCVILGLQPEACNIISNYAEVFIPGPDGHTYYHYFTANGKSYLINTGLYNWYRDTETGEMIEPNTDRVLELQIDSLNPSTSSINILEECFPDVPYDHDFNTYICNLKNDNVIDGYPDGTYKPNNLVNRGAMAKFMINGSGMPINTNCPQFSDIPADYEFANMIRTLKCNGVISGYPDGKYKPNNNVDRGAMAKFIKNGFNIPTNTTCGDFLDVKPTHGFYTEITSLKCANVISGYPDGTYKPNNLVNRGAMAKFIDNARSLVSI
jgi:hypothetical protein